MVVLHQQIYDTTLGSRDIAMWRFLWRVASAAVAAGIGYSSSLICSLTFYSLHICSLTFSPICSLIHFIFSNMPPYISFSKLAGGPPKFYPGHLLRISQQSAGVTNADCSANNKRCLRSSNTGGPHIWRKLLYFRPTITFLLAAGGEVAKIGLKYQAVTIVLALST